MNTDDMTIDANDCDNLIILRCINRETREDILKMQKEICEMEKSGVIVLPKNVYVAATPKNLQHVYRY